MWLLGVLKTFTFATVPNADAPRGQRAMQILNLQTSNDIYFQNALDDTASFPNVPDVDDDELAEFLAVVVDRTGQPVEVRSNNDQFSCDIRNLKSAQSQFLLVTQQQSQGLLMKLGLLGLSRTAPRQPPNKRMRPKKGRTTKNAQSNWGVCRRKDR